MTLPLEVPTSHLLYGSRKETSNETRAVFRLTKFCRLIESGCQFSTWMRKTWPFLLEARMWFPLGKIFIEITESVRLI